MHPGKYVLAALACAAVGGACAPHQRAAHETLAASASYERPAVHVRYVERAWEGGRQVGSTVTHDRPAVRVRYIERASRGGVGPQASVAAPWSGPADPQRAAQARFVTEQQQRMAEIGAHVRGYARSGLLPSSAVGRWANERDYVNELLSQYTADGRLTRDEQRHVETSVLQMYDLEAPALATIAQRENATATTARGGGPAPHRRTTTSTARHHR